MPDQGIDVKIRGVRQLSAGTRQLFANIDRATVNDAVRVSAEQTAATIRSRVPVRTGALRASVRDEMHGKKGSVVMGAGRDRHPAPDRSGGLLGRHADGVRDGGPVDVREQLAGAGGQLPDAANLDVDSLAGHG